MDVADDLTLGVDELFLLSWDGACCNSKADFRDPLFSPGAKTSCCSDVSSLQPPLPVSTVADVVVLL